MGELFDNYYKIGKRYNVDGEVMKLIDYAKCSVGPCEPHCNANKVWDLKNATYFECGYSKQEPSWELIEESDNETTAERIQRIEQQIKEEVYGNG
jgi:hypothetical protein